MIDSLFFYFNLGNCIFYKAKITPWARSGAESEVIYIDRLRLSASQTMNYRLSANHIWCRRSVLSLRMAGNAGLASFLKRGYLVIILAI